MTKQIKSFVEIISNSTTLFVKRKDHILQTDFDFLQNMTTGYNEEMPGNFYPSSPPSYHSTLPLGTYSVNYNSCRGQYYLQKIDNFKITGKLYGDVTKNADRMLKTFIDRESSTGALLCGQKGSGKTLTTKYISSEAMKLNMPTLIVNSAYSGVTFNNFMQGIQQASIVIFDEYEKVYKCKQEALLTLLDGVYPTKKLFLLTSNDRKKVGKYFLNRPGRLFYVIDFHGINWELINVYLEENLKDNSHIETVLAITILMSNPNFDMIKALVEEMNRYNESPIESLQFLNIRPQFNDKINFKVTVVDADGKLFNCRWTGNPMKDYIKLKPITVTPEYFSKVEVASKSLIFMKDGYVVKLSNCPEAEFTWSQFGSACSGGQSNRTNGRNIATKAEDTPNSPIPSSSSAEEFGDSILVLR